MYFFEVKAKKQIKIMTAALPYLKPFLEEFKRAMKLEQGGNKSKALKEAQQELITAEALLINRKDDIEVQETALKARTKASSLFGEAQKEQMENNLAYFEEMLESALTTHYDNAINILALFSNKTVDTLEEEKDLFELAEMLFEIIESKKVADFLLRVRRSKLKMQSDISEEAALKHLKALGYTCTQNTNTKTNETAT